MAEAKARDIRFYKGPRGGDWDRYIYALYVDGGLKVAGDYHVIEEALTILGYAPDKDGYHSADLSSNFEALLISHGVEMIESGDFVLGGVEDGHNLRYAALTLDHVEVFREIREHAEAVRSNYVDSVQRPLD